MRKMKQKKRPYKVIKSFRLYVSTIEHSNSYLTLCILKKYINITNLWFKKINYLSKNANRTTDMKYVLSFILVRRLPSLSCLLAVGRSIIEVFICKYHGSYFNYVFDYVIYWLASLCAGLIDAVLLKVDYRKFGMMDKF